MEQSQQRVLSIQSHVVSGYVGNKAAVFPLQLLGFDVDFVNSVHFSNHTGYEHGFEGDVMNGEQLLLVLNGLERNGLLDNNNNNNNNNNKVGHLLTGYIGSESFLRSVLIVLKTLRKKNPQIRFVCDPVLGDAGKFYVPPSLVPIYRDEVLPFTDIVTPNQFEVEQLTDICVKTIDDAKRACKALHKLGPNTVLITSVLLTPDNNDNNNDNDDDSLPTIAIIASQQVKTTTTTNNNNNNVDDVVSEQMWCIDCPIIPGNFTGTGDLCTALLLAWSAKEPNNLSFVLEKVISTMYAIIRKTADAAVGVGDSVASRELHLIQSKRIIEDPQIVFKARQIFYSSPKTTPVSDHDK
eukprot:CAMPEP_0197825300 /NCGR_PEP_ID=MMETSP1437-20131217/2396_1 /TAXON_ID=49252 ORGANISM="Eucampia antarctica, Strain CCMP1452" /NCGR_SAMPLE_ID=MMETSP1437 /ASSEMBLY_ACC=CAM_ASM_001096 /LENGTH=351 /DNA_ID=CAMNT_0043425229 /DNA_START=1 /DNA_END=1056 /DNA_ORIENTATION=+